MPANKLLLAIAEAAERYRKREATAHELDVAIDAWREGEEIGTLHTVRRTLTRIDAALAALAGGGKQ